MAQPTVEIKKYGPYGSKLPENYGMQLKDCQRIKELTITHGYIVDAIEIVVANFDGSTEKYHFGGHNGDETKIVLENGEYVTRISGTCGFYHHDTDLIGTLKVHTNLNPNGYGPYGKGIDLSNVQDFSSPDKCGAPVVGFFGRSNTYLESIGVSIREIVRSLRFSQVRQTPQTATAAPWSRFSVLLSSDRRPQAAMQLQFPTFHF